MFVDCVDIHLNRHVSSIDMLLQPDHGKQCEVIVVTAVFVVLYFQRARDLFYALWVPDLFMKRVEEKGKWSLMCPNECPGLQDCYGDKFEELYTR